MYTDNIIVMTSNQLHVFELVLLHGREFSMKDLGPIQLFLGVEVKYFMGGVYLSRSKYVASLT